MNEGLIPTHKKFDKYDIKFSNNFKAVNEISIWRKRAYNLRAHFRDINSQFLLYNKTLHASSGKWIDVYNNLFALNSQFNPRHIYYVSYTLQLLLSRGSSHLITTKFQYNKNAQQGKKQKFSFLLLKMSFRS